MPDKDIMKKIKDAILKAVEKDISIWASKLEEEYPKWKGSRFVRKEEDKISFGFDNDHATQLEVGSPAKAVIGRYIQQVKAHPRKGKGGGRTKIKAHQRVYKNYKPIKLPSGLWKMVSKIPKLKAKEPISKSAKKRFTGKAMEKLIADAIKQEFK